MNSIQEAKTFIDLDDVMRFRLQSMLEGQIGGALGKIEEEMGSVQTDTGRLSFGNEKNST